ncbi:MAG: DUF924 family protein [Pseudomonadota bacterium]
MTDAISPKDILDYWSSLGKEGWWTKNADVDEEIKTRFGALHDQACFGKLDHWAKTADGALALIIILDQFSRNMFRGDARSFSQDQKALSIAAQAIDSGLDKELEGDLAVFLYMPYEHSEEIADQKRSVLLQHSLGASPENLRAALQHREIIQRFGRFPHRNAVLGRHTTPAEQAYLDSGGFSG